MKICEESTEDYNLNTVIFLIRNGAKSYNILTTTCSRRSYQNTILNYIYKRRIRGRNNNNIEHHNKEITKVLIRNNIDIDVVDLEEKTILIIMCETNDIEMIVFLLEFIT